MFSRLKGKCRGRVGEGGVGQVGGGEEGGVFGGLGRDGELEFENFILQGL